MKAFSLSSTRTVRQMGPVRAGCFLARWRTLSLPAAAKGCSSPVVVVAAGEVPMESEVVDISLHNSCEAEYPTYVHCME